MLKKSKDPQENTLYGGNPGNVNFVENVFATEEY